MRHKRKGFGARTNTAARAVNSPESCISRGGWSPANTNTGLAREDLHRWARFPPFQIPSPVVPSAICCPPPYPPAAVNSWVCHSLEPLIMSNQSLLYLFIYLYTVWSQVSSLRRRLLPSKHAQRFDAEVLERFYFRIGFYIEHRVVTQHSIEIVYRTIKKNSNLFTLESC